MQKQPIYVHNLFSGLLMCCLLEKEREEEKTHGDKNEGAKDRQAITAGATIEIILGLVSAAALVVPPRPRVPKRPQQAEGVPPPGRPPPFTAAAAAAAFVRIDVASRSPRPVAVAAAAGELEPADGARVVEPEPRDDAVGVVHVVARHLPRLLAELELLLAHRALRAVAQVRLGDEHARQRRDRRGLGGRGAGAVVLRELVDEGVQIRAGEVVRRVDGRRDVVGAAHHRRRWDRRRQKEALARRRRRRRRGAVGGVSEDDPSAATAGEVIGVEVGAGGELAEGAGKGGEVVDLVEEAAVAAGAEDVGGGEGDDAEGAAALVAPVEPARPSPIGAIE